MRQVAIIMFAALLGIESAIAGGDHFQVLAYHDVRDEVSDNFDADQYAVSVPNLIDHFTWLRVNGFNVISVDDVIAAKEGLRPLPERAVLLSFDDGFASVATHVVPLLELFEYPAVVSIVTNWIDTDPAVRQAGRELTRDDFLTWAQVKELAEHELVEIASHSHDLHRGILANPQGNEQPAAVSAKYTEPVYESPEAYSTRIRNDISASVARIEEVTGNRPRVMTWPFGAFNVATLAIAADLGMEITLTLTDGMASVHDTAAIPRHLIEANPGVRQLGYSLLHPPTAAMVRAAQVDLDYVYDADPVQQEENLGRLLDRIQAMEITHVFLQAFADPDADGGAQALYFPNRHLPMRADLFNRAAWQLKTRANVDVFAWLPILSYEGAGIDPDWRVMQRVDGALGFDQASEPRLSPFSEDARAIIKDIYADLARHAAVDGLLFHDDGRLNEFEDWSPSALAGYRDVFGPDFSQQTLTDDAGLRSRWADLRSQALVELTGELADTVRHYRPDIRTVRNLFATALLEPASSLRLAQRYDAFIEAYDYVAIMAMPRFEGYENHRLFYTQLAELALAPDGERSDQVIFELQTIDWRTRTPIDSLELEKTMRKLQALGIRNLAYYPDDFIADHPSLDAMRRGMSIATYPRRSAP